MSNTYWKDAKEWVCPNHLPSLHIPASVGVCLFTSCNSLRPRNRPPGVSETEINSMNLGNTPIKKEPVKRKSRTIIVSDESFEEIEEPSESSEAASAEEVSSESSSVEMRHPSPKEDNAEKEKKNAIDEKLQMIEARILAKKLAKQAAQEQISLFPDEPPVHKKDKKKSEIPPSTPAKTDKTTEKSKKVVEEKTKQEEKTEKKKSTTESKTKKADTSKTTENKKTDKTSKASVEKAEKVEKNEKVEKKEPAKTDKSIRKKKNKVVGDEHYCDWFQCNKGEDGTRGLTPINSKYCSKDCSNKNARWRYKKRQNDDE